ncbi:MAG: oxidoreductase [Bacteroidetes bacterium]|nr:oxidoreductase [Bacteroidota bacterium]
MKNKIIVITGGASGIGLAIINELVENNTIISIDRNPVKIASLKSTLPKVDSIKADVTSSGELDAALAHIDKTYGKIDLLINNAGKGGQFDFINTDEKKLMDNIAEEIAINYTAPIMLSKKALPLLKKSTEPAIVIVSSGLAYVPMSFLGTYCASKAAIHFVTMSIRLQLESLKIRVVEVLPPIVDTVLSKDATAYKMPPEKFAKIFLTKFSKGENVMNIGQTSGLEKFSRFLPKTAFKMLNKGGN